MENESGTDIKMNANIFNNFFGEQRTLLNNGSLFQTYHIFLLNQEWVI